MRKNAPSHFNYRLILLAVAVIVVALMAVHCRRGRAEYRRRLDQLRSAGEPVTEADVLAMFPDQPPENDFRLLLRSVSPQNRDRVSVNLWDSRAYYPVFATNNRQPLSPEILAQVRVYRLLARHGWRKVAPDTRQPKSQPEVQEAWEKNSPQCWQPC